VSACRTPRPRREGTLLAEALDASQHGIFVSDEASGRFVAVNDAACRLLGYERGELLRLTARAIAVRAAVDVDAAYDELLRTGSVTRTAQLRRADGAVVEIGYADSPTQVARMDFLLTLTDAIGTARVVAH
jgi:PAS domain S-box-containing protein